MSLRPMNKRGLSIMIGYVLLITIAVIIGVVVYSWLKTYVPTEVPSCPDGTSLFVKGAPCEGENLSLTLENNGRFDVSGYYIRGKKDAGEDVATIDLGGYDYNNFYGEEGGVVIFKIANPGDEPGLRPGEEWTDVFNLSTQAVKAIEIVPVRYQERNGKLVLVVCSNSISREDVTCGG